MPFSFSPYSLLLIAGIVVGFGITGYHFAAAAVLGLGAWGYLHRARHPRSAAFSP